jgi:hypothetical protein
VVDDLLAHSIGTSSPGGGIGPPVSFPGGVGDGGGLDGGGLSPVSFPGKIIWQPSSGGQRGLVAALLLLLPLLFVGRRKRRGGRRQCRC